MKVIAGYRWETATSVPRLSYRLPERSEVVSPDPPPWLETGETGVPFDLSIAMSLLCHDISERLEELKHIDTSRILFTMVETRARGSHGLQARVIAMRNEGGSLTTMRRGKQWQVQRFIVEGVEILYLVGFTVPRFLNADFEQKLITVIHELFHISPNFDGSIRNLGGRYKAHSGSQKKYDEHMKVLAEKYLASGADYRLHHFLRLNFAQLCKRHGKVIGFNPPRPKLIPVTQLRQPGT